MPGTAGGRGHLSLEGVRALVTASTRGIGYATARVLARLGARVVVNGRTREGVELAVERLRGEGLDAWGVPADLSKPGEAGRLVAEAAGLLGGLDALVYNPPPPPRGGVLEVSLEDWRLSYRLLVEAPLEAVREALKHFEGGGSIVFITSIAAIQPLPGIATSSVLRPGLHVLTRLLAWELGPRGVRVNSVAPGYMLTDRLRALARARAEREGRSVDEVLSSIASTVPLRRIGEPESVGWVVAFLVSSAAEYVSGAIILVSGGLP